ncbi:hypothetical protein WJX72_005949 [[Myrmecia] bisecta]|uniref:CRAL-TRIO domain-containing protein n=1 Tax=[Myrmecia] bisecta TaxID=41462 RepID=A0AAW1PLF3_9CHLO
MDSDRRDLPGETSGRELASVHCHHNWPQHLLHKVLTAPFRVTLRGNVCGLEAAGSAIVAHAHWRAEHVPRGRIFEDEIPNELAAQKVFLQGVDLQGRPVLIVMASRHDMGHRNIMETKQLICYTLDNAIAAADTTLNKHSQILCLFDLSGLRMNNLDLKALQAVFELLQQHYPERLAALWFLNAPMIFWGIWRLVGPFIQPATKEKIQFLSGAARQRTLNQFIPQEVLPEQYGGAAPFVPIEQAVAQRLEHDSGLPALEPADDEDEEARHGDSRLAAAQRAVGRWAGAGWNFVKRHNPVHAAQSLARAAEESRPWHAVKGWRPWRRGPKRVLTPEEEVKLELKRKASIRRQDSLMHAARRRLPAVRPLVMKLLIPDFLMTVLRKASQAIKWAWTHVKEGQLTHSGLHLTSPDFQSHGAHKAPVVHVYLHNDQQSKARMASALQRGPSPADACDVSTTLEVPEELQPQDEASLRALWRQCLEASLPEAMC